MAVPPRRAPTLRIRYEAEDFPGKVGIVTDDLLVSWDEILWSAITLGRPNLHSVFQYGEASYHEAIFRMSAIRMAIEQRSPRTWRLARTDVFKSLDPTEKGAVSYFLGMTFCKVFAARHLDTPWLLHLDIFRAQLGAALSGRSRPDLIGQAAGSHDWHAFECKGRASPPNAGEKAKAKAQAHRLVSVGGSPCSLHVGSFTYFKKDTLQFYWRDPEPKGRAIIIPDPVAAWRFHYEAALALYLHSQREAADGAALVEIEGLDMSIAIHPLVLEALLKQDWARAHAQARQFLGQLKADGYEADGLAIRSGPSWTNRFRPDEGS